MAKIKYNVKGVERGGGNYEQPKPGLYEMEIAEASHRDADGKNDIEIVLEVTKNNNDFVGSRVWNYIGLGDTSLWKLAEFTDALGLPEEGAIDTAKLVGKKMKVKINADSYNGEYRARVGRMAPLESDATDADGAEDPDAAGGGGTDDPDAVTSAAANGDEPVTITRNDVEISNDPAYYAEWSDDDVFEEIENQKISLGRKKKSRENVIAALVALVDEEAGSDAEEEGGDNYDDAEAWSDQDLWEEVKKRELQDKITGKKNRDKFIAALREDDADESDPFT